MGLGEGVCVVRTTNKNGKMAVGRGAANRGAGNSKRRGGAGERARCRHGCDAGAIQGESNEAERANRKAGWWGVAVAAETKQNDASGKRHAEAAFEAVDGHGWRRGVGKVR